MRNHHPNYDRRRLTDISPLLLLPRSPPPPVQSYIPISVPTLLQKLYEDVVSKGSTSAVDINEWSQFVSMAEGG